ncbi:MAG: DUF1217 domain-containing protein [Pseudomonadota bacterium]
MTYQPALVGTGIVGWRFLERTYDTQFQAFTGTAQNQRETDYFREKIGDITSAEELVSDRRLLNIALTAFGLEEDLDNRFFMRKILEDGTSADDALANRLADERYAKFSEAFGFGPGETPQIGTEGFSEQILAQYEARSFEAAVGEVDESMRIALYAEREVVELASEESSERTKWFTVMGVPPLRELFETAFGLPDAFGQQDLEQQLETFQDRARSLFGSTDVAQFTDPEKMEKLVNTYLARAQIEAFSSTNSPAANALLLLSS